MVETLHVIFIDSGDICVTILVINWIFKQYILRKKGYD